MGNEKYKILLADDEPDVLEFLGYNLKKEGYQVYSASNGREAIAKAKEIRPHLIILDIMMPEMDGIETCNEIKQVPHLQNSIVIFLTARGEDYSQVAGFEAGADDYVTKPIKSKVLVSRVKALLRRYKDQEEDQAEQVLEFDEFSIDLEKYIVLKGNQEVLLPRKEFQLLNLLASRPNKVFTRDEIMANVWGSSVVVGDRTIDVHVRKIRERLDTKKIKTIKGVGYKFED